MPYKKILYTITCQKCNLVYQVNPQAYFRKQKDPKYGSYCKSCRAKAQWDDMTEAERNAMKEQSAASSKKKYQLMSDDEKQRIIEKRKAGTSSYWSNLTDDQRKEISEKRSNDRIEFLDGLNEKQMKLIGKKISNTKVSVNDKMSAEELLERRMKKQQERKEYWSSLSENNRDIIKSILRDNNEKYIVNMSDDERQKRSQIMTKRNNEFWGNASDDLVSDQIKKLIHNGNVYRTNITDEERQEINDKIKFTINNKSDEEKEKIRTLQSENLKKHWENKSDEERQEISKRSSVCFKQYWDSLSLDERNSKLQILQDASQSYRDNLTDEDKSRLSLERKQHWENLSEKEKQSHSEIRREYWNSLSDYDKNEIITILGISSKEYWKSLSDKEKELRLQPLRKGSVSYYENLTNDQREKISKAAGDRFQKYRDNLTDEDKIALRRKMLLSSAGNNKFHQKFENTFDSSMLSNTHFIVQEIVLMNNLTTHSWDYGIYSKENNDLVMVVDLDGSFYHADSCDYDGLHSKEEYDERRFASLDDGIQCHIIYEEKFKQSFESMIKLLMRDYDSFIMNQFRLCRAMPFPYQRYQPEELINSFNQLIRLDPESIYIKSSTNTRVGDRIISHFHPSIYHASVRKSMSPYDAWYNDDLLMKVIRNRVIYVNTLNPNKILQGFNVCKVASKVSVFSAGRAKILINKYLNDMNEIFDPFSGFSGRMLGAISLGKKYIGQDISENHIRESIEIRDFLSNHFSIPDATLTNQDILQSSGEYQCLFTCSPYSDKEQWVDIPSDSRSCDDWIDECLQRFKCQKYLFVVDHTKKYKDHIVDEIINKSHFGINNEYVIMINK